MLKGLPQCFIDIMKRQELKSEDQNFADGHLNEDKILLLVKSCNWSAIISESTSSDVGAGSHIKRRVDV